MIFTRRSIVIATAARSAGRARHRPGGAAEHGGRAGPRRAGAEVRGRSALAEAAAEPLAARLDDRRLGRRARPRLDHPPQLGDAATTNERGAELSPPTGECCAGAPPVLEFDPAGNLVQLLGRPGRGLRVAGVEPRHHRRPQGQRLDRRQRRERRAHPEVHARTGKFLHADRQARRQPNGGSNDPEQLRPRRQDLVVDAEANEAYVADGYGNKRVAVLDADTGEIKRYWGAYGNKPDDTDLGPYDPAAPPAQQFRNPVHCAELLERRLRLRLRSRQRPHPGVHAGRHVRQGGAFIAKNTLGDGLGLGHRLLARTRSRSTSTWPTARTRRSTSSSASRWRC